MHELTHDTFDDFINLDTPSLVNFWALGCMPCQMFAPILADLSAEMNGRVAFGKLQINDDTIAIAQRFGVSAVPTTIFFLNGKPVGEMRGAQRKPELQVALNQAFAAVAD